MMSYKGGLERPDCLAVLAVLSKEASVRNSQIDGKIRGIFSVYGQVVRIHGAEPADYAALSSSI